MRRLVMAAVAQFGRESLPAAERVRQGPPADELQTLESTVQELLTDARGKAVVVLASGQMWRQSSDLTLPRQNRSITVTRMR
jgi:hypothetical protein